jgi:hypothetical protein
MYHPLSFLAAHSPGYWKGHALNWNTFWRLASLGVVQMLLFSVLRKLNLRNDVAFVLSFITVYNLRTLDMFRYGASLENYTGFLLLCATMIRFYIAQDRIIGPASLIGATYLLVSGGHPQIAYLGILGAGVICLAIPPAIKAIRPELAKSLRVTLQYYAVVVICTGIGLLLASAYTFPFFFEFLRDAPTRINRTYEWSLAYSDRWGGAVNSFFNPLQSDVHGAFGSSPLILTAALAPVLFAPVRGLRGRPIMIVLWLLVALVFLCSLGSQTPIHYWFWKFFPFADTFRAPGRITMLLPPVFMLILAWFFLVVDDQEALPPTSPIEPWHILVQAIPTFAAGYLIFSHSPTGRYTPHNIQNYPVWVDRFVFCCGLMCLVLAMLRASRLRVRTLAGPLFCIGVVLQIGVELRFGTWIATPQPTPTLEQMDQEKRSNLAFRGEVGYGMESRTQLAPSETPVPFAFFDRRPAPSSVPELIAGGTTDAVEKNRDRVTIAYSTFNQLVFQVDNKKPGSLILAVPYSSQWHASVDSCPSDIHRSDRNGLAILLPSGNHQVQLRFWSPSSMAGVLITCSTGLLVSLYFARECRTRRLRLCLAAVLIVGLIGGFFSWKHSLYNGDNLGMQYQWFSDPDATTSSARFTPLFDSDLCSISDIGFVSAQKSTRSS